MAGRYPALAALVKAGRATNPDLRPSREQFIAPWEEGREGEGKGRARKGNRKYRRRRKGRMRKKGRRKRRKRKMRRNHTISPCILNDVPRPILR